MAREHRKNNGKFSLKIVFYILLFVFAEMCVVFSEKNIYILSVRNEPLQVRIELNITHLIAKLFRTVLFWNNLTKWSGCAQCALHINRYLRMWLLKMNEWNYVLSSDKTFLDLIFVCVVDILLHAVKCTKNCWTVVGCRWEFSWFSPNEN